MKNKEIEWTIVFNFPINPMYPNKINGYQSELNQHVKVWNNKNEAEEFAKAKCGKYGWNLVPTKVEIIEE